MGRRAGQSGNWPKAMVQAKKASEREGWVWTVKGSGHWTVRNPQGEFVVALSATFYDGSLTKKYVATLRKAGCPGT